MFEQVDIARAKAVLGDTACICGNLPTSLLLYGRPHEVVDETRLRWTPVPRRRLPDGLLHRAGPLQRGESGGVV